MNDSQKFFFVNKSAQAKDLRRAAVTIVHKPCTYCVDSCKIVHYHSPRQLNEGTGTEDARHGQSQGRLYNLLRSG
jgi:hypothetical protein